MLIKIMETNNFTYIWLATDNLEDYFSMLSGAGRYIGYSESDIPSYIVSRLLQMKDNSFNFQEFVNHNFFSIKDNTFKDVLQKVDNLLTKIISNDKSSLHLVKEYYNYINKKLTTREKTKEWLLLGELINKI